MSNKQRILRPRDVEKLRIETGQTWKPCVRKDYDVFACVMDNGFVFANCLLQPVCHRDFMRLYGRPIISMSEFEKIDASYNLDDFSVSGPGTIVVCGSRGDLTALRVDDFLRDYCSESGGVIELGGRKKNLWFKARRPGDSKDIVREVGICVPQNIRAQIETAAGLRAINSCLVVGHHKGDVLTYPVLNSDLEPDFSKYPSIVNSWVFNFAYNQHIGGWNDFVPPANKHYLCTYSVPKLTSYVLQAKNGLIVR